MIECHSNGSAIRLLNGTCQDVCHTVSEDEGSLSRLQYSIFTAATFGNENLDFRTDLGAWDGRGHHFEGTAIHYGCLQVGKSSAFAFTVDPIRRAKPLLRAAAARGLAIYLLPVALDWSIMVVCS